MTDEFPVLIGICFDAEALWLGRNSANAERPVLLSHGAFAAKEGLDPLLALLERHRAKATFFVPGITAERYADAVRAIHGRGHEIASHTYSHRPVFGLSADQERSELVRGIEAVEQICGVRPVTWRSAAWEWSANTLDLLLSEGVTVSANFHDRIRPYRHEKNGKPVDLVELPVQWHLADAPFFGYGGDPQRRIASAAEAEAVWMEEFEASYDWPGAFFHLTLHVQLIGHPGRLKMLDRVLSRIRAKPNALIMTCKQLAAGVP
jgi:peptidoglycan/xylan/chitin deacetylase (PgdA/CDA1 family)